MYHLQVTASQETLHTLVFEQCSDYFLLHPLYSWGNCHSCHADLLIVLHSDTELQVTKSAPILVLIDNVVFIGHSERTVLVLVLTVDSVV